ncbi:MAG: hypothetical protein QXU74_03390 [Candidatus Aenigmatarchaeota archaeon]
MKGILKSFEVLIAILFVLAAYFTLFGTGEKIPDLETVIWKIRGFEALKSLDDSNKLASYALANETEKIKNSLTELLPLGLEYEILVCDQTCPSVSINSEKIASVSYFIAGNVSHVEPREVLLYIWRGT